MHFVRIVIAVIRLVITDAIALAAIAFATNIAAVAPTATATGTRPTAYDAVAIVIEVRFFNDTIEFSIPAFF